ncbi:MAG: DUF4384 domain-containing protein [Candidatus Sumerlaeota bacterium]|nr:DUF4384 domain-containing protein [Candidatus Sumerlaeota bacterium]
MKILNRLALTAAGLMLVAAAAYLASAQQPLDKFFGDKPGDKPKTAPPDQRPRAHNDIRAKNLYYEPPMQPATPAAPAPPMAPPPAPPPAPNQPPAMQPGYIGLKYKILLQGPEEKVREVPEIFPFRSGQRFQLVFESNINGFLYIFHKGSNSKGMRLFPDLRINGGRNEVKRFEEFVVPFTGWLKFDERPGMEDLYFFVTPQPLDAFDNLQCAPDGSLADGAWAEVTAATTNAQPPRPDAARAPMPRPADAAAGGPAGEPRVSPIAPGQPPLAPLAPLAPGATDDERGPAMRREAPMAGGPKNIVFEPDQPQPPMPPQPPAGASQPPQQPQPPQPPMIYTPPVVQPENWNVNVPASSYVVENAPMLIHHVQLQHHP